MKNIILTLCALTATSCATFPREMTYSYDPEVAKKLKAQKPDGATVRGESCGSLYFLFPAGVPTLEEAYKKALEKTPGTNALADAKVSHSVFVVPVFYAHQCLIVEGTPVIL